MKYVFFGTPKFAAIILEKLIKAGLVPEAVISNPDKPIGRKQIITPPPVKALIMKHATWSIPILQPEKLDKNFMLHVSSFMSDVFIVAAYSQILPKEILQIPRLGTIGVHPSLLPKYRGATPIQTAILNDDEETGVSLFLVDEKIDHGKILAQRELKFPISNIQYPVLSQKLAELAADLLIETLPKYIDGKITPTAQDESQATYTKKFSTQDGYVEPSDSEKNPLQVDRKIRALNPEPGVWTIWQGGKPFDSAQGKRMKILEAEIIDGYLKLKKIQFEGKKPTQI